MTNKDNSKLTDETAHEAAAWFIRLRDEDLTEAEFQEWQDWLAMNSANGKAFAKAENCWAEMDNIPELPQIQPRPKKDDKHTTGLLRRFAPIAATILVILSVGFFIQNSLIVPVVTTTYQTARAEHKTIQLDDGSAINLGGRSIVNIDYSDSQRHVTLVRGEAVFDVAKNKTRPFIVQVGKGTVTAIGTKFNIHSTGKDVTVTVLEGIVEVNPDLSDTNHAITPLPRVSAGKAVSYHDNGDISEVVTTNIEAAISWEKGLLVRVDTPLAKIIEDVNRYSPREIIIGDASLNNIRFTGTVLNDGIDNWLRGLSVAYPIKVLDSGQDAILLLKKDK